MTPTTPSIGHIYALQSKLDEIFAEGLTNRYERHARTNALVHDWVARARLRVLRRRRLSRSITLTCVKNNRGIDVAKLVRDLREKHHLVIDGGYGKLKGQTFRLSNMGDETEETVSHLLAVSTIAPGSARKVKGRLLSESVFHMSMAVSRILSTYSKLAR